MTQTTSPTAARILDEYRAPTPGARRRQFLRGTGIVGLTLAVLIALLLPPTQQANDATEHNQDLSSAAVQVADPLQQLCAGGDETARRLQAARTPDGKPLCAGVAELKEKAAPVAQSQTTVIQSAPPSFGTVYAAVEQYCAQASQPCRGADGKAPDLNKIVQAVLAQIPVPQNGKDAPAATPAQILAQVAVYCGRVTQPCRGPAGADGKDGVDGTNGTDGTDGKDGINGKDGRGVQMMQPIEGWKGQDGCWWVTTYTDNTEQGFEVDPAMCGP